LIKGFCEYKDKRPKEKEGSRVYSDLPLQGVDFGARMQQGFVKVDIDDYDHKTGELVEPINGKPRSEAIKMILDDLGIKYNLMVTESGKHFYFRISDNVTEKSKINWYTPIGIKVELKLGGGSSKEHIPIKVNGVERKFVVGDLYNEDIDYLPVFLHPLQKPRNKPFDLDILSGDRNNSFSSYLFHLVNKGYSSDDAEQIVMLMNKYILDDPLPRREVETIIRDETKGKLKEIEDQKAIKNLQHFEVGDEVISEFKPITFNGSFYCYKSGVYDSIDLAEINSFIGRRYKATKINFKREVIDFVRCQTYVRSDEVTNDIINVKNGILKLTPNKVTKSFDITLEEHSPDIITFRQFNAVYHPNVEYQTLDDTLHKVFCGDQRLIDLFDEILGYLLMNHVNFHKAFFFVGKPSGGKSNILKMITKFIGKNNVSNLKLKDMNDKFRLAGIVNKTANIDPDMDQTTVSESGNFKSLVTGDAVTIEEKYSAAYSYYSTAKLFFGCNTLPHFTDKEGVMRRPIIVPFNRKFTINDPDFNAFIDEDLSTTECMSALLNRAIEGYKRLYLNNGFTESEVIKDELNKFKIANSNVLSWIAESELDRESLQRELIMTFYNDFLSWCHRNGVTHITGRKAFTEEIKNEFNLKVKPKKIPNTQKNDSIFVE